MTDYLRFKCSYSYYIAFFVLGLFWVCISSSFREEAVLCSAHSGQKDQDGGRLLKQLLHWMVSETEFFAWNKTKLRRDKSKRAWLPSLKALYFTTLTNNLHINELNPQNNCRSYKGQILPFQYYKWSVHAPSCLTLPSHGL